MYFSFRHNSYEKSMPKNYIPVETKKSNTDIFPYFLYHNFNNSVCSLILPLQIDKADITPIRKKRPLLTLKFHWYFSSSLQNLRKIFDQTYIESESFYTLDYDQNTRYCLLHMVENLK